MWARIGSSSSLRCSAEADARRRLTPYLSTDLILCFGFQESGDFESMAEKLKVLSVAGGAVGLGGFAAALGLCCGVPWAVALLGISGAIAFARLSSLLPFALVGAILFLAFGFWLAYREPACTDEACAPHPPRLLRLTMWITAVVVVGMAAAAVFFRVTT